MYLGCASARRRPPIRKRSQGEVQSPVSLARFLAEGGVLLADGLQPNVRLVVIRNAIRQQGDGLLRRCPRPEAPDAARPRRADPRQLPSDAGPRRSPLRPEWLRHRGRAHRHGAERTVVGAERTASGERSVIGAERTVIGAERTVIGAERTVIGAERTVIGAERTVIGAERTVIGAERTVTVAGSPPRSRAHDQRSRGPFERVRPTIAGDDPGARGASWTVGQVGGSDLGRPRFRPRGCRAAQRAAVTSISIR